MRVAPATPSGADLAFLGLDGCKQLTRAPGAEKEKPVKIIVAAYARLAVIERMTDGDRDVAEHSEHYLLNKEEQNRYYLQDDSRKMKHACKNSTFICRLLGIMSDGIQKRADTYSKFAVLATFCYAHQT